MRNPIHDLREMRGFKAALIELPLVFVILFSQITSSIKALCLLAVFFLLYRLEHPLRAVLFFGLGAFFAINDLMALKNGIFLFLQPDHWGLPWFEYFIWGFYFFHTQKVLSPTWPARFKIMALILGVAFSMCFALSPNQLVLMYSTFGVYILSLILLREKQGYLFSIYFIFIGTVIEHLGVYFGHWAYPGEYWAGVAYWYIAMWGGIGLFYWHLMGKVWNQYGHKLR